MSGSVPAPLAPRNSPLGYSVRSTTAALAAFVFTDSLPFSGERRKTRTSERRNKNEWWALATIATASRHHRTVGIGPPPRGQLNGLREKNSGETSLVCRERPAGRKMSPG